MKAILRRTTIVVSSFSAFAAVMHSVPNTRIADLSGLSAVYILLAILISLPGVLAMFDFKTEKPDSLKDRLVDVTPTLIGCAILLLFLVANAQLAQILGGVAVVLTFGLFTLVKNLFRITNRPELE